MESPSASLFKSPSTDARFEIRGTALCRYEIEPKKATRNDDHGNVKRIAERGTIRNRETP